MKTICKFVRQHPRRNIIALIVLAAGAFVVFLVGIGGTWNLVLKILSGKWHTKQVYRSYFDAKIFLTIVGMVVSTAMAYFAYALNRRSSKLAAFNKSLDLLNDRNKILDDKLSKLTLRQGGKFVVLAFLLKNDVDNHRIRNMVKLAGKKSMFRSNSASYIDAASFMKQLAITMEFIDNTFIWNQETYVSQVRALFSVNMFKYVYLFAVFSEDGRQLAEWLAKLDFFNFRNTSVLPGKQDKNFYWENEFEIFVEGYFMNPPADQSKSKAQVASHGSLYSEKVDGI